MWYVFVVLLVFVACLWIKTKQKGNTVLFGPSGGGKTALFFRLKTGAFVKTVPSMVENVATISWQGALRRVIDVPHHGEIRKFLPNAERVIFVVDGLNCVNTWTSFLEAVVEENPRVKITVACNKNDSPLFCRPEELSKTLNEPSKWSLEELGVKFVSISVKNGDLKELYF